MVLATQLTPPTHLRKVLVWGDGKGLGGLLAVFFTTSDPKGSGINVRGLHGDTNSPTMRLEIEYFLVPYAPHFSLFLIQGACCCPQITKEPEFSSGAWPMDVYNWLPAT
jgi:hypothetical protein